MAAFLQQTVDNEHIWGSDLVYQRDPKLKKKKTKLQTDHLEKSESKVIN